MAKLCQGEYIPSEANATLPKNRTQTKFVVTVDDCRTQTWVCWNIVSADTNVFWCPLTQMCSGSEDQRSSGAIVLHMIGLLYMFYALALV